jgi:NodT family efflux transporter outer membrane factor (OMF) lipoprotein
MRPAVAAVLVAVAGCAAGPDFHPPPAPNADYGAELPPGADLGADLPRDWWRLFQSPALTALVERSLAANPSVAQAEAALRVAEETYLAARGVLLPSAAAGYGATRAKAPAVLSPPLASGASPYTLHTAQLSVSYSPDVFGGVRRSIEAAAAQAEVQRFGLEAARIALSANVVAAAIQEASLRAQAAATREMAKIQAEQLALMEKSVALGAIAEAGVVAQRAALAQTRATLPLLEKQLALERHSIAALAGALPAQLEESFDFAALALPAELPVSLPSRLVEQRPDVRAAQAELHAASADIGVASAAMLPQFTLDAAAGSAATQLASLFSPGTALWTLGAAVAQPVFRGGALVHRKRAAEAAYQQAEAQYRSTVLGAFQNVADALDAVRLDGEALAAAAESERLGRESLAIAERQVALGDASYLALLAAELAWQQARLASVQARANRYADTVALFQALGGGWWNR